MLQNNTHAKIPKDLKASLILLSSMFMLVIIVGFFFYRMMARSKEYTHLLHQEEWSGRLAETLRGEIETARMCVKSVAAEPAIRTLITTPTAKTKHEAQIIITTIKHALHADYVYIMNEEGTVIASTDEKQNPSIAGNNYAFRPYFTEALEGVAGFYFAIGVTTKKRGLYLSYPVYPAEGTTPLGVAIVKLGLSRIDTVLEGCFSPVALLTHDDVIFAANRRDWLYKSTAPLPPETRAKISNERQIDTISVVPLQFSITGNTTEIDGDTYTVLRKPVFHTREGKWTLLTLENLDATDRFEEPNRGSFVVAALFVVIMTAFMFFLLFSIQRGKKIETALRQHRENLARAVESRTKELRGTNAQLSEEVRERKEAQDALTQKTRELAELNHTLEGRVRTEVEKRREQEHLLVQQSKLAAMGEMISMIAHQWRQPLSSITTISGSEQVHLSLGRVDAKALTVAFQSIDEQAQFLSKTINDFRHFFKPNKERESVMLSDVLSQAITMIEKSYENKGITITVEHRFSYPITTYANELMQVFISILKNAQDVIEERGFRDGTVRVTGTETREEQTVVIADNAGGIPEDVLGKVFDPYFTTKTEQSGTGLGLYMAKIIVERHCGGTLTAGNTGEGAHFIITIPKESTRSSKTSEEGEQA